MKLIEQFADHVIASGTYEPLDRNFKKNVGKIYQDKIGYDASFQDAEVVDGPHKI